MDDNTFVSYTREQKKQMRADRKRIFHVVEHFDFISVIDDSPVQLADGYVISDVETHELFASFEFQNLSQKEIARLHIRLLLFKDLENVPYVKIPFTYSHRNLSWGIRRMPQDEQKKGRKKREPVNIRVMEYFGKGKKSIVKILAAIISLSVLVNCVSCSEEKTKNHSTSDPEKPEYMFTDETRMKSSI